VASVTGDCGLQHQETALGDVEMKHMYRFVLAGTVFLGLAACATVPSTDELQRLSGEELRSALTGNTYYGTAPKYKYADYYLEDGTSYTRVWGSWGSQRAKGSNTISDDGEWCTTYSGDHDWTTPDHEYCSVVYTDDEGNYYGEVTKNTYNRSREGNVGKVEIKPGDTYNLAE
jgi:hypothetical protein